MTISYIDSNRRDDLRSAALFVVDPERQAVGYDKRVRGSAGVPDVVRVFDEVLASFPLESEIGGAIKSADELPCWKAVLDSMGPVWSLWPTYSAFPDRLVATPEWSVLKTTVEQCVSRHRLWIEEIEFPVMVATRQRTVEVGSWRELEQTDHSFLSAATVTDDSGRTIELRTEPAVTVRRVGMPSPVGG